MQVKFPQNEAAYKKEGNDKSKFHENVEEATDVSVFINKETYEKIVNVSNLRTKGSHQIKQAGYEEARNFLNIY